jgi:hypothetical protein
MTAIRKDRARTSDENLRRLLHRAGRDCRLMHVDDFAFRLE